MKTYLKVIIFVVTACLLFGTFTPFVACAEEAGTETRFVYDDGNLLTTEEERELQAIGEKYAQQKISVVFVTTIDTGGLTTQRFSNKFYDKHNFYNDGIQFVIDMQHREVYIDTVGQCIPIFSRRIERMLDKGFDYIYSGSYGAVFTSMFNYAEPYLKEVDPSKSSSDSLRTQNIKKAFLPDLITVLACIAVTALVLWVFILKHKKAMAIPKSQTYFKAGKGFTIRSRSDQFIRTRRQVLHGHYRSSSGSGGRSGGGGRSHGGGGRRF